MPTKTISVDLEAYGRLVHARKHRHESFSEVIKRARWEEWSHSGAAVLATLKRLESLDPSVIRQPQSAQKRDKAPRDKRWTKSRATRQKKVSSLRGKLRWSGKLENIRRDRRP
jgi:hypothetical protein